MSFVLLILLTLVVLAALNAAASAVRSVSRIWLRHWAEAHPDSAAAAESPGDRRERLLAAALAGAAATTAVAGIALGTREGTTWQVLAELLVLALVLVVLGQLVPRALARRWAARLMPGVLPPLRVVELLLELILRTARWIVRPAARRAPSPEAGVRDELEDLLREGELEGVGEREEIAMISGVVQFQGKTLHDVMTPRTEIFALPESTPPRELALAVAQSGYSRVPVYAGSLDEIVGVIHVLDVIKTGPSRMPPIRQVAQAPASKPCTEMLVEMLRAQRHLAVVLDEFGGTAGIVTLEDMLEEMVGEIRDEHDEPAHDTVQPPRALLVDASEELAHVAEQLGLTLSTGERSIGGLLLRGLGRIPAAGERFRVDGLDIIVVTAEQARVKQVLVQRADLGAPITLAIPD